MTILIIGAICIVAAIVGGGLKGAGWEFPVLTSKTPRMLLAGAGIAFVTIGLIQDLSIIGPSTTTTAPSPIATATSRTATSSSSTVMATSSTEDVIVAQAPVKSYKMTASYNAAINLDNGKQVTWTRLELPAGADVSIGNFRRIAAREGSRLYKILADDPLAACRAAIEDGTGGASGFLVEELVKGDVICTDTDQGRIALLTVVAMPRDLYKWTGGLLLDVRLWSV